MFKHTMMAKIMLIIVYINTITWFRGPLAGLALQTVDGCAPTKHNSIIPATKVGDKAATLSATTTL